jgi:hypothetical protein
MKVMAAVPPTMTPLSNPYAGSQFNSTMMPHLTAIYVPAGSVNAYKTASGWKNFADNIFAISE